MKAEGGPVSAFWRFGVSAFPVQVLDASGSQAWDEYLAGHPEATFFHGWAWKRAVERAFGHRSWYLVAARGPSTVGVLPLFEINSIVAGRFLLSVPYATYGGVLADDDEAAGALLAEAKSLAGNLSARSVELRSLRAADPLLETRQTHATFRKVLPSAPETVLAAMPRKARAAARRAAKRYDLSVEFHRGLAALSQGRALTEVWRLYARSMRRLGSPNYPFRFFKELVSATGEQNVVQIVRRRGRPVAGLLTFLHRDEVMPYFSGVDDRASIYGLSNFLYAESMRWGVEHGFRRYDFGRSRIDNAGAFNFKRFCGFEPQTLQYQVYVPPGRIAPDLAPSSRRWAAARRVWKVLPLPVTRPLGAWLARSIPG